ncbi:hypothetical protein [Sphingobacterium deserti]|uniref:Uncharacterized protein n=1 Tax=Sphingobacterium deserti TaxID=1229276 RepID=A0A0B8SYZ1_9SPHI|nr:hypothetical protein [Sphingobacterium deserti]KGE12727.1 hypothetical protein DI53_3466 [Sphingobacterium deserti]
MKLGSNLSCFKILFFLSLLLTDSSQLLAQKKVAFKSKDNLSLFFSNQKGSKNWTTITINSGPQGSIYSLNGAGMEKPESFDIKDAYLLDDSYYAIPLDIQDTAFFFFFSIKYGRALLISDIKKGVPIKVELREASKSTLEGQVKIESMIPLLRLLL